MQICQNCSVITIETSPTNTAIRGRSRKYWIAAPYPSSYHWYEGIKELPWKTTEKSPKRTLTALFIGSVKTSQPNSNDLRKKLYNQCTQSNDCNWIKTAHSCSGVSQATRLIHDVAYLTHYLSNTGRECNIDHAQASGGEVLSSSNR
jgi:hypothetical protein